MPTVRTTVVLTIEHNPDLSGESAAGMVLMPSSDGVEIVFVGKPRPSTARPRISEMVGIKELMKEAYSRLKKLHVKEKVFIYQDLIQGLLKI